MSDILVYNESSRKFGAIEGDQLSFSILKASYVYDIKEFSLLLSQRPYKLVFIVCDEAIEPDTIRFIKACKNVSFQRDASLFVFFFQQNYSGVRQALLAGACQIYLDPVPWRRIREDMLRALNPDETGRPFARSSPIRATAATVQVYGRLGEVNCRSKFTRWTVESDVSFPEG